MGKGAVRSLDFDPACSKLLVGYAKDYVYVFDLDLVLGEGGEGEGEGPKREGTAVERGRAIEMENQATKTKRILKVKFAQSQDSFFVANQSNFTSLFQYSEP